METWRDIPGWEGEYQVSDLGRVRSVDRITANGARRRGKTLSLNRAGKYYSEGRGYWHVALSRDGKAHHFNVHTLVAAAFLGPRPDDAVVCHNDDDPFNNEATNLRYDTYGANLRDSVKAGTHVWANRESCPQGHRYTDENTYRNSGRRYCRTCRRERERAKRLAGG